MNGATRELGKKPIPPQNVKPISLRAGRRQGPEELLPEDFPRVGVSMKHFFQEHAKDKPRGRQAEAVTTDASDGGITTISYPEQKRQPAPSAFMRDWPADDARRRGMRCVACLCLRLYTACPAQYVFIEAGEYPPGDSRHGCDRFPVGRMVDEVRCIFCGYRVKAVPVRCLIRLDCGDAQNFRFAGSIHLGARHALVVRGPEQALRDAEPAALSRVTDAS